MAIDINSRELPITAEEARDIIQSNTDNFGVFIDMDRCFELAAILQLDMADANKKARRIANNPTMYLSSKEDCIAALESIGVPHSVFINVKTGKLQLTAQVRKSIIENIAYKDEAKELCKLMDIFSSAKRNKGNIENFATQSPMSLALSKDDHRMAIARPSWKVLATGRIAASNPGIQGIPKTMSDIICEPKGYTLIRADSGQIEPRINFSTYLHDDVIARLITYYDDAYYGMLHYCVISDERLEELRQDFDKNFKPLNINDEIKDMRATLKTLSLAGTYGSSNLDKVDPRLAAAFERRITNHPSKLAREQEIRDMVNRGEDTFYSWFGRPITPDETDAYHKNDSSWKQHLIRCGLNNPVQATASDLMIYSVYTAREILSRAKDSHICFYKHDEACFYVSDEDMANGIGDALKEVTAYNVAGWIPIHSEVIIGKKEGQYPTYL